MSQECHTCQAVHQSIPDENRQLNDGSPLSGVYFECSCGSTMFIPNELLTALQNEND